MKEADLRKRHRYIGVFLAIFIISQAGTGLLLSVAGLITPHDHSLHATENVHHGGDHQSTPHQDSHSNDHPADISHHEPMQQTAGEEVPAWVQVLRSVHGGGGIIGGIYRIAIGLGVISMAMSGLLIFFKIQSKKKQRQ
ncbi:MAG: PepSY domain-containing protein [Thermodesulfobacteriota bacterium]